MAKNNILEVRNLNKTFRSGRHSVQATKNVSFDIAPGKVVGLIGESGSGKTTAGRIIMNLHQADSGSIKLMGREVAGKKLSKMQRKHLYKNVQMIFQDPYSSLNGQKNIMSIVAESLYAKKMDKDLLNEYLDKRDDILFYFQNEIKESVYKDFWAYRRFANKIAIKNLEAINKMLDMAQGRITGNIAESFNDIFEDIYEIKEETNYEIISKLDKVIENAIKLWKQKQISVDKHRFGFKEEKILSDAQDTLKKLEQELESSETTRKLQSQIEKLEEEFEYEDNLRKSNVSNFLSSKKTIINNIKSQLSEISHQKSESITVKEFNFNSREIERLRNTIFALKRVGKKIVILRTLYNEIDELYRQLPEVPSDVILDKKSKKEITNEVVIELVDSIVKKAIEDKIDKIEPETIKNNIEKLEEKLKASIESDKERKDDKIKKDISIAKDKVKKAEDDFEISLTKYREESSKWFNDNEESNKIEFTEYEDTIKSLRKEVSSKEKEIFKQLLKGKEFNKLNFKALPAAKRFVRAKYNKMVVRNNALNVEIKVNMRILKKVKFLFNIFKKPFNWKYQLKNVFVRQEVFNTLVKAGLNKNAAYKYPHEFSGGMRQRVGIARALISKPKLIIADEPIAALDLSIQAQIVNLLLDLKRTEGISLLFIAHDLSMVEHNSDEVLIMHKGRIVEYGDSISVFKKPFHPYTKNLMSSIPSFTDLTKDFEDSMFNPSYLEAYSVYNKPQYNEVSNDHFVLGTLKQFGEWGGKVSKKKASAVKALKKPVTKKPAIKKPVTKKVVAKKPTTKKPVVKKPVSKKTATKKVAAKKAVTRKPNAKKAKSK